MDWHPRENFPSKSNKNDQFKFEKAINHPLSISTNIDKINSNKLSTNLEKKSSIKITQSINKWIDPLSAVLNDVNEQKLIANSFIKSKKNYLEDDFENWNEIHCQITNKSIALVKSIKKRALIDTEFTGPGTGLTSLQFIQNINNLNDDLIEAWENNSRVKALRTVSLIAKNLTDIERFDLYMYKFVLSVKIIDNFNDLIYQRIENKMKESNDIEIIKETCRNWCYKICSIQELLSRLYLEIATLNTFNHFFIYDTTDKLIKTIQRLIETVSGIGDPFVAIFVYVYLSKTILNLFPEKKELFFQIYTNFLSRINQIKQIEISLPQFLVKFDLAKPNETCTYLNYTFYYTMPIEWILKCLLYKSTKQESEDVYKELNVKLSNHQSSDLFFILFQQMLPKLNSSFVIENQKYLIELIKTILTSNKTINLPKYQLISNLSIIFLNNELDTSKIDQDKKLELFKEIWKLIKMLNEKEYIICTNAWIDFAVRYFNINQINSILNNLIKYVISKTEFNNCNENLIQILVKILNSSTVDYKQFLASDSFVPFIGMFQKESIKVIACKTVIEHLIKSMRKEEDYLNYSDSEYMTILMYVNKTMHDSVDQLTSEEERKELSNLIIEFINLVQFDCYADHLDFLVQCRSNFSNFNNVIVQLVFNANKLSLQACENEDEQMDSNSFLKACLAFSCITIPSIDSEIISLMLYRLSAEISLKCGFIEQTEFFIRSSISILDLVNYEKISKNAEIWFVDFIKSIISFLILVPDDLSRGYLYLFKKLLKTIIQTNFKQNDHKISIYLCMLNFLTTMNQSDYPYHLDKIESNDIALLNDNEFKKTIKELGVLIIEKILEYLESLAQENQRQSYLAFDCFHYLLLNGETKYQWKLLFNFWQLAIKNLQSDVKTIQKSIDFTRQKSIYFNDELLDSLAKKLQDYFLKKKLSDK